jgi:cobalamin biosynthesis protein CobD/CbiB
MRLEYQILTAILLDFIVGDPPLLPHPVKLIGRFASLRRSYFSRSVSAFDRTTIGMPVRIDLESTHHIC